MKKITLLLIAALAVSAVMAAPTTKKTRRRAVAAAVAPAPVVTQLTIKQGGHVLQCDSITAEAYYKVSRQDAGDSNGYSDNTFIIDWPVSLDGVKPEQLQRVLLNSLSGDRSFSGIDEMVKEMTECEFDEGGKPRRVARLPKNVDSENCLADKYTMVVHRLTSNLIVYRLDNYGYFGGGTFASVSYGSSFINYDLTENRELVLSDVLSNEAVQVLARELRNEASEWDSMLDEEFLNNPYLSENFVIEADRIGFFYPKYAIAAGFVGPVTIELPLKDLAPYLKRTY